MNNIITRLSELEAKIKSKNDTLVLIVNENNEDGLYTFNGQSFTRKELDKFCVEHGVENLIIDDFGKDIYEK